MKSLKYLIILLLPLTMVTGCLQNSVDEEPPDLTVNIEKKDFPAVKGTYTWETEGLFSNEAVIADAAAPYQIAEDMNIETVKHGEKATLNFSDDTTPKLNAYTWKDQSRSKELEVNQNKILLPSEKGKYVVEVMAHWPNGESSYTFLVEIK
ncbi:hypothetical protein ABFG93_21715 (plasmid) [Pseudalkalibacillus hwajinpoensis]|uniref:hypothetical protein n=1 Tax=Guptibacillus hwajinpoensis TaxID=208199 RepID=UPI00325B3B29